MTSSHPSSHHSSPTIDTSSTMSGDSYEDMSVSEIVTELHNLQSEGIHYAADNDLDSQCEFVYNKSLKGSVLIPKDNASKTSEFILAGVFQIDPRNFFMTSDGKWNQNNAINSRFDQVKPSCHLGPIQRNEDFSLVNDQFSILINNIRTIQNLANPQKSRDVSNFIVGNPPTIKITHHLFVVCPFSLFSHLKIVI